MMKFAVGWGNYKDEYPASTAQEIISGYESWGGIFKGLMDEEEDEVKKGALEKARHNASRQGANLDEEKWLQDWKTTGKPEWRKEWKKKAEAELYTKITIYPNAAGAAATDDANKGISFDIDDKSLGGDFSGTAAHLTDQELTELLTLAKAHARHNTLAEAVKKEMVRRAQQVIAIRKATQ